MKKEFRLVEVFELVPAETSPGEIARWRKESTRPSSGLARFHQWGVDYYESESGPGNYTVAIVEYENGTVEGVRVDMMKFIDLSAGLPRPS